MNKELRELCVAYANGLLTRAQYREIRRLLIERIVTAGNDDVTLPMYDASPRKPPPPVLK